MWSPSQKPYTHRVACVCCSLHCNPNSDSDPWPFQPARRKQYVTSLLTGVSADEHQRDAANADSDPFKLSNPAITLLATALRITTPDQAYRILLASPHTVHLLTRLLHDPDATTATSALQILDLMCVFASGVAVKWSVRLLQRALDGDMLDAYIDRSLTSRAGASADEQDVDVLRKTLCGLAGLVFHGMRKGAVTGEGVKRLLQHARLWSTVAELGRGGGWGYFTETGRSRNLWLDVLQALEQGGASAHLAQDCQAELSRAAAILSVEVRARAAGEGVGCWEQPPFWWSCRWHQRGGRCGGRALCTLWPSKWCWGCCRTCTPCIVACFGRCCWSDGLCELISSVRNPQC
jgi:hypothetical protein